MKICASCAVLALLLLFFFGFFDNRYFSRYVFGENTAHVEIGRDKALLQLGGARSEGVNNMAFSV